MSYSCFVLLIPCFRLRKMKKRLIFWVFLGFVCEYCFGVCGGISYWDHGLMNLISLLLYKVIDKRVKSGETGWNIVECWLVYFVCDWFFNISGNESKCVTWIVFFPCFFALVWMISCPFMELLSQKPNSFTPYSQISYVFQLLLISHPLQLEY